MSDCLLLNPFPFPRRLTFAAFLRLLALVASKKGAPLADVAGAVARLRGPAASGATEPEYVRFHDDRSTYTGRRWGREACMACQATSGGSAASWPVAPTGDILTAILSFRRACPRRHGRGGRQD